MTCSIRIIFGGGVLAYTAKDTMSACCNYLLPFFVQEKVI